MNIQQISSNIDRQVSRIEQQIAQLQTAPATEDSRTQINQLEIMRNKLIKSKELAWETQGLVGADQADLRRRKRLFGLCLAIASSLGILILTYLLIAS